MADNPSNTNMEDILLAQALQQMNKSANRVKTSALLVALVEFANSGDKTYKNFDAKYPTVTVSRLRQIIKANDVLAGRIWPISNDEFGVCLVNVTATAQ